MYKKIKYAINGALICGIGNGILNINAQTGRGDGLPPDGNQVLAAFIKGIIGGGLSGFSIGAIEDYFNDWEKPINTDAALMSMIEKIRLDKNGSRFKQLDAKAEWLIQLVGILFHKRLYDSPFRFGSTEKDTALEGKSDIDICLSFQSCSFSSVENMFFEVERELKKLVGSNSIVSVRRQSSSIGIFFSIKGRKERIDILPKKMTDSKGNKSSGYIYVNRDSIFEPNSYKKTDVYLLNSVCLSENQKRILIVLKCWKAKYDLSISAHLLQHLILDTYRVNYGFIPKSFTKKVILVLRHIEKYLDGWKIRSVENSNNILNNIPESDKASVIRACRKLIDEYEYQKNSIVTNLY